jgi:hypothetical protein
VRALSLIAWSDRHPRREHRDKAGRDQMTKFDGIEVNFEILED